MEQFAERVPVSWQTVQQWENGKTAPKRARLEAVAKALNTTSEYLALGAAKHLGADEFVAVRHLGVRLSAGHGKTFLSEDEKSRLLFRADFLRTAGVSPEQTVSVSVKGAGMEPLIPDGATVLVNRAPRTASGLILNCSMEPFLDGCTTAQAMGRRCARSHLGPSTAPTPITEQGHARSTRTPQ